MNRPLPQCLSIVFLAGFVHTALAVDAPQAPKEATGPDVQAAKQFIQGAWTVTMLPPEGSAEKPRTLTMVFAEDGRLSIRFDDESDSEEGAWLVTAAKSGGGDYLLDEGVLDENPEDDIYLDIAFNGPDKAAGVLHDSGENETMRVSMARAATAASGLPAKTESVQEGVIVLSAEIPSGIMDAVDSLKTAGLPADAVFAAAAVDLDADGVDEALVKVTQMTWCSGNMETCRIVILKRTSAGKWESLGYPYAKQVALLPGSTNGFRDLAFDGAVYVKGEYGGYDRKP